MHTLALMNQKGGSGKTTTAVNLAAALGELERRVLLVDLDPQASATAWLGRSPSERGLYDVLTANGNLADLVADTDVAGVALIPSSSWLVGVERALAGEVGAETIFRRALGALPPHWDLALLDCPPSLGLLSVSALVASRAVLVPVEAHVMAMAGLAALLQTTERVRERLNPELAIAAILACRVNRTNLAREVVARLRERFGDLVLDAVVRESVRLAEAPSFGRPITTYDPRGAGAEDYRAVARELLGRIELRTGRHQR